MDQMQGVLQGENDRIADLTKQQGALESQGADIEKRRLAREQSMEQRFERQEDALKPPKLEPVPSPTVKSTDPKVAWGSSAMWLAGLSSLMTRTPLTTAMNAAAEVLNGYRENDEAKVNQAFQTWKIASDNALKAFEFEQQTYRDALGRTERREQFEERQSDQQAAAEERERVARLNAVGRSLQDTYMAQVKSTEEAERMMEARERHADSMAEHGTQLMQQHAVMQAMAEWKKQHPQADAIEQAQALSKMMADFSPKLIGQREILDEKLDQLYKDPAKVQTLVGKYEASVPGKAYRNATTAGHQIDQLSSDPDVYTNPAKQIGLVDKLIFMETGSIRPALAQYQKILGAATGRDMFDMAVGKVAHHPVLGHDQIKNIISAANELRTSARKDYQSYLSEPERAPVAEKLGLLDENLNLSDNAPQAAPAASAGAPAPPAGFKLNK